MPSKAKGKGRARPSRAGMLQVLDHKADRALVLEYQIKEVNGSTRWVQHEADQDNKVSREMLDAIEDYWYMRKQASEAAAATAAADAEYSIECVLYHVDARGGDGTKYLVRWENYGHEFDEWLTTQELSNARTVLATYKRLLTYAKNRKIDPHPPAPEEAQDRTSKKRKAEADSQPVAGPSNLKKEKKKSSAKKSTGSGSPVVSTSAFFDGPPVVALPHEEMPSRLPDGLHDLCLTYCHESRWKRWAVSVYEKAEDWYITQQAVWAAETSEFGNDGSDVAEQGAFFDAIKDVIKGTLAEQRGDEYIVSGLRVKTSAPAALPKVESAKAELGFILGNKPDASHLQPKREPTGMLLDPIELDDSSDDERERASSRNPIKAEEVATRRLKKESSEAVMSDTSAAERRRSSRLAHLDQAEASMSALANLVREQDTKVVVKKECSLPHMTAEDFASPFSPVAVASMVRELQEIKLNAAIAVAEPHALPLRLLHETEDGKLEAIPEHIAHAAPVVDFRFIARSEYGAGVRGPVPLKGCNCIGSCRANKTCACWRRQSTVVQQISPDTGEGFAYDESGHLRYKVFDGLPIIECDSNCGCSGDCINRQAGRGRSKEVKLDLVRTQTKGWAVKLAADAQPLEAGKLIFISAGEIITHEEAEKRDTDNIETGVCSYLFDLDFRESQTKTVQQILATARPQTFNESPGRPPDDEQDFQYTIDARHMGNLSRYVNHSCLPNLYIRPVFVNDCNVFNPSLAFFTHRRIEPGQELTISYKGDHALHEYDVNNGMVAAVKPKKKRKAGKRQKVNKGMVCHCGSVNCDGQMWGND